jgi:hypothetical protein
MEKNMKRNNAGIIICALGLLALLSCNQDPIFFSIAAETFPEKPRIEGAPTNMVLFNWEGTDIMFVASGKLHWYAKMENPNSPGEYISRWDSNNYNIPQPRSGGEKITSLAVTKDRLYALCINNQSTNTTLRFIESGNNAWTNIPPFSGYQIQSIYADPEENHLFAGVCKSNSDSYAILYLDNEDKLVLLKNETALLSGAAYQKDHFFLSTRGLRNGGDILKVNKDMTEINSFNENITFMGMIKLKDTEDTGPTIIAVARNRGALYEIKDGSLTQMEYEGTLSGPIETGRYATGALALWQNPLNSDEKMLIVGIQGGLQNTSSSSSSYTHGYVEFDINTDDTFNTGTTRRDSGKLRSVGDNDQYTASLGKQPINHMFQAPEAIDANMIFFASTQTAGLWSNKNRPKNKGVPQIQWNAEE